jgi:hypothetical protein
MEMATLEGMGFGEPVLNVHLLHQCHGNVQRVAEWLLEHAMLL